MAIDDVIFCPSVNVDAAARCNNSLKYLTLLFETQGRTHSCTDGQPENIMPPTNLSVGRRHKKLSFVV